MTLKTPSFEKAALMSVELETGGRIYNQLAATGVNCTFLRSIVKDIFLPHLRQDAR